ncbi:MAG: carboxypeptidase regulatory-like domain-containing protein [Candidatus Altiarchaeota archaeon]
MSEDNLDAGDGFTLTVELENKDNEDFTTSDDLEIKVYIDDVLVHEDEISPSIPEDGFYNYTVTSSSFDVDGDKIYNNNLMNYECGADKVIKVEIGGDAADANDDDAFEIEGDDLSVDISPDSPTLDKDITVTVKDEDNDELDDADVKFTFLGSDDEWDADDKYKTDNTDSNGEMEITLEDKFSDDDFGTYQIDVYKSGYCKYTTEVSITNELIITGPVPENPTAGQSFTITAKDGSGKGVRGLIALTSPGGYKASTNIDGVASFKIDDPGVYQINIGGGAYPDKIVTVTVAEKPALEISVEPAQPKIGDTVKIKVISDGAAVSGASVSITVPGGTYTTLTTSGSGEVTYAATIAGIYSIDASKTGYSTSTTTFTAQSAFNVLMPSTSDKKVGDKITITVQDGSGNPVVAATVTMDDGTTGTTDTKGQYTFTIPSAGEHILTISKNGFITKKQDFSLTGKLIAKLSEPEIELGKSVTIEALDKLGSKVEGVSIVIIKPDGTTQAVSTQTYKPTVAGNHTVTITKTGYTDAKEPLYVKPKQLILDAKFEGDTLILKATSYGEPVANMTIAIETPAGLKEALTDDNGVIMIAAEDRGSYTASAKSDVYDSTPIAFSKGGIGVSFWWIAGILAILIVLGIIGGVAYYVYSRKGGGSRMLKPGKSSFPR